MTAIGVAEGKDYAQAIDRGVAAKGDPFDYQRLLNEWSGNTPFLHTLLETFTRESAVDLAALERAVGANDATQVAKLAHRIKGSAAVMGAPFVREQAALLEAYGQTRELNNDLVCLGTLRAELQRCSDFVSRLNRAK